MTLTPEEQEAISAYPEEKVQRIPMGKSGVAVTYIWDAKSKDGGKVRTLYQGRFLKPHEGQKLAKRGLM